MLYDRHPAPRAVHVSIVVRRRRIARRRTVAGAAMLVVVLLGAWLGFARPGDGGAGAGAGAGAGGGGALGRQDGYLAVGASVSPFSSAPAVAKLDPRLRTALHRAARAAAADGVTLRVNSGWRSARYQETLLRRAVKTYGSAAIAHRYVKPPAESKHVTGEAVDVGPLDASLWLAQHGSAYGLCQTYVNERWHFERVTAPGGTCPAMASDAAAG